MKKNTVIAKLVSHKLAENDKSVKTACSVQIMGKNVPTNVQNTKRLGLL